MAEEGIASDVLRTHSSLQGHVLHVLASTYDGQNARYIETRTGGSTVSFKFARPLVPFVPFAQLRQGLWQGVPLRHK